MDNKAAMKMLARINALEFVVNQLVRASGVSYDLEEVTELLSRDAEGMEPELAEESIRQARRLLQQYPSPRWWVET